MTQNLGSTSNPLSMTGEQWVLEERTDDPLSPEPGECWIRSDLNAGDKIATLKFGDGSEVPIFPTATSEPGVLEVRRVQTGGQTGYLPVAEPDESRFPQFRLQHNNTVYSLHDDIEPGVIPDSALHQYKLNEDTDPFIDSIGNADATNEGTTQVTGAWVEDAARSGDGVDDNIISPVLETYGSELDGGCCILFTISDLSSGDSDGRSIMGAIETDSRAISIVFGSGTAGVGEPVFILRDDNHDLLRVTGNVDLNDGSTYRVAVNKSDNTGSGVEFWVNGVEQPTTIQNDLISTGISNFTRDLRLFAQDNRGTVENHLNAILDNIILTGGALTQSDIESDYNSQPWS